MVSTAATAVQRVTCILARFISSVTAASVRLCGAVVFGAVVLGVPAVPGVDVTGLKPRELF